MGATAKRMNMKVVNTKNRHLFVKSSNFLRTFCALVVFSICLLCYMKFHVTNVYWHSGPIGEMNHNAHLIGNALIKYQRRHDGALPSNLSELVPDFIDYSNVDCFFRPPIANDSLTSTSASGIIFGKIDRESAYVYLGVRGRDADLVLYERTSLWSTNRNGTTVVTLTSNLTPQLRSIDDVYSRLMQLEQNELDTPTNK